MPPLLNDLLILLAILIYWLKSIGNCAKSSDAPSFRVGKWPKGRENQWSKQQAHGEVILVRYADDFVVGFEHRYEAERFRHDLAERLKKFNLELHGEKTRLIEFGRYAETNRARRGMGKPETFNFLGFTHICSWNRRGQFCVLRQTMTKRMRAKLKTIQDELKQRMHHPIPEQGQ